MPVSKRTRFEVLRRDNYTCRYCKRDDRPLVVDHVLPVALGGTDEPANLAASCTDCNQGKASTGPEEHLVEDVSDEAIRWAAAMRQAATVMQAERLSGDEFLREFDSAWQRGQVPSDWETTVLGYLNKGLPREEILHAVEVAQAARGVDYRWAYFCGVARKKVERLQDIAAQIMGATDGEE